MNPSELAAKVAAHKAATLEKLQPVKMAARAAEMEGRKRSRELKESIKENQNERELVNGHNFDLFPTPPALAAEMVRRAGIRQGDRVLEPSAGTGRLAKAAKEAGAWVVCVEFNHSLIGRLLDMGFEVICKDFMEYTQPARVDAVIMNPPFSNGADIDHVRHAYDLLTEGNLVAIMSEGSFYRSDKKATAFRAWLESVGGESEQLPAGTFRQSGTNVSTRLVTISKRPYGIH